MRALCASAKPSEHDVQGLLRRAVVGSPPWAVTVRRPRRRRAGRNIRRANARLVRLPPEEVTRSGVTVEPVGRTTFRTYRTFPGVVRPNENALANITTLVRGRVAEVHADLGQMVVPNQLLAVLHSGDLGLAQSAYLKARARRHVAEQAYQRAQFLFNEKVIGQAEAAAPRRRDDQCPCRGSGGARRTPVARHGRQGD